MAGKRRASARAGPDHGGRKRKRRAMASVKKDPTYVPAPSTPSSQASTPAFIPTPTSPRITRSSTSHTPDSIFAAMAERVRSRPRKWSGENLGKDLASQTSFLRAVASDEAFLSGSNVAEVTTTLKMAGKCLETNASEPGVSRESFRRAKGMFEAQKDKYVPRLSQILGALADGAMLPAPLSYGAILSWYSELETLLHNTRDYAYDHGLKAEWDAAATNIIDKYNEGRWWLQSQSDASQHGNPHTLQRSPAGQSASSLQEPPCPMELLQGPRNTAKAQQILDHLTAYYKRQMIKETKRESSEIFSDLHTIKLCVAKLFSDSKELKMTLQQILGKDKIHAYHDWCLQFEALRATPAIALIQQRFQGLRTVAKDQPLGRAELMHFELSQDLNSLAMLWDCPENASREELNYLVPRLVSEASAAKAASDLEQEYLSFQDQAYAGAEITRLWLLVWRTLKATHFPLPTEPEEVLYPGQESKISELDPFAIERAFFESKGQPSSNQISLSTIVQKGDVNNPHWIEGFVSNYCDHVAMCHNEKEKYYWQFSTMAAKVVPTIVITTLQASNQQVTPHPERNMLLHRVVLRLNYLLGDDKLLKRWSRNKETGSLAYLDINMSSTGVNERGQSQKSDGAVTIDNERSDQGNADDASHRPTGPSNLRGTTGGAAGNGGQDGDGSGHRDGEDRGHHGRSSKSSASRSSSNESNQENKTPSEGSRPLPTGAEIDAFVRNSTSPRPPQMPRLGCADDEAAADDVQTVLESLENDPVPVSPPPALSVGPDSDQENAVPRVKAGSLPSRDIPSAFPWTQYPLGETRASERAQSMQVEREMRQRGIATSGPHVEDVENIVPGPLRLAPSPENHGSQALQSWNLQNQSIISRAIGVLLRGLNRPLPSVRPEPLPTLPPRRSPRRPTVSPLTANRDGSSGVRRARDRVSRSPSSRRYNNAFAPRRSWLQRLAEAESPLDDSNEPSDPSSGFIDMEDQRHGAVEEQAGPGAAVGDTTAGPIAQTSEVFIDLNTARQPTSPTPQRRGAPARDTARNITARTVQLDPELGASPPREASPPLGIRFLGDGLTGAGPEGDPQNGIPPWQWIPRNNENFQAFLRDDQERVARGEPVRVSAREILTAVMRMDPGDAVLVDIYQLLRARYEWGLTHTFQFPQHVPGYPPPNVLGGASPRPNGVPGPAPGRAADNQAGRAESEEMYRGASADADPRPDPAVLNRASVPRSWGSFNGGANRGNQDFDLYASSSYGPSGSGRPGSRSSLEERRNLLQERYGPNNAGNAGSRSSISGSNLPSPLDAHRDIQEARIFISDPNGTTPRPGVPRTYTAGSHRDIGRSSLGRRNSGASSLARRRSSEDWVAGSGNGSQQATPRPNGPHVSGSVTPEAPSHPNEGTQSAADRLGSTNVRVEGTPSTGSTSRGGPGSGSRGLGNRGLGSRSSHGQSPRSQSPRNQGSHGSSSGSASQPTGSQGTGGRAGPSRAQYENMTIQQLRDEIRARGGNPPRGGQRKADLVQILLDYDNAGNYGNGAQPRRLSTAIPPHPTTSPRRMRPRDGSGRVTRK